MFVLPSRRCRTSSPSGIGPSACLSHVTPAAPYATCTRRQVHRHTVGNKIEEVLSMCLYARARLTMQFPPEITNHIAAFISDDVQACDPRCYRASRCVQAAWRGWATRFQQWRCWICQKRALLGIKMVSHSGHVYARVAFGRLGFGIVRRAGGRRPNRIPLACSRCHTCSLGRHYSSLLGQI